MPEISFSAESDIDIARALVLRAPPRQAESVTTARISSSARAGFTSMTLWLLKSRCTTPTRCAAVRPAAI